MGDLALVEGKKEEYRVLCDGIPEIFKIENYPQIQENPKLRFITVKKDDVLIGGVVYLITDHRPDPESFPSSRLILFPAIYGEMFGILPEYRLRGLGTQTLDLIENYVKREYDAVLFAAKARNERVIQWFAKRGYLNRSDSVSRMTIVKFFEDKYEQKLRENNLIR